jgi:hypothetical protein
MVDTKRQIVIHSDYVEGDTEGPYRDARSGDTLVSPDKVCVYDGVLADGYLELSHDGIQGNIESSLGPVNVDGVEIAAHASRHLGNGEDSVYVVSERDPLPSDDGYAVGMHWLNTVDGYEHTCFSNLPSAAVWRTASGGGGSGITEAEHELLDTLVHDIDETSYDDVTYGIGSRVDSYIVWANVAKLLKIREEQYSYSGSKISQVVMTQYDGTGAVKMTITETYTYTGSKITSITRTKS